MCYSFDFDNRYLGMRKYDVDEKENKSHTDKLCVIRLISTIGILGCVVNTKVNTNECVDITYSFSLHVGIQLKQPS